MKLSSFSEIANNKLVPFIKLIAHPDSYWAHIDGIKSTETLEEHTNLVLHYAKIICKEQRIDSVIDKLIIQITSDNKHLSEYVKLIFVASIAYHDFGKVNPNFQVERMKNSLFQKQNLLIRSRHSALSAFVFLFFFVEKISIDRENSTSEKEFLLGISYLLTFPILNHHNSALNKESNITENFCNELFCFLNEFKIELPEKIISDFPKIKERLIATVREENLFPVFALLKFSYSLLTACDYYATNKFMAGIEIDDFGILTLELKRKITDNFKSKKDYNKDLIANFDKYLNRPFSELQEQNRINLNALRQKLNAEVVATLRQNSKNHWYYIEAPTGAGKTNLSLACISELLQSDESLNKVFYVFPFTTLITQTYQGIKDTIGLNGEEMIQLHSKAGFHSKEKGFDGNYGNEKQVYLDNLFVNYPFCVTSHVRFFEILKGNSKESNYLLHRLCNSIVVIDELQTYNPAHWDKIVFFIENYARLFNMRFIIMSATLPKIDELSETAVGTFINLTPNKKQYFLNKNFSGRIDFDFSLLDKPKPTKENKEEYLLQLSRFMLNKSENYFSRYGHSRVLIEFITKNTASLFFRLLKENNTFNDYQLYILSGDILEPQRRKVIRELKDETFNKVILVSTQVIEAGVDIDMDLGFKDRSLLDSDEQLAGRINRNASKTGCKVFLFDCDKTSTIYGKDKRYKQQQRDEEIYNGFKDILLKKHFDVLYQKVFKDAKKEDWTDAGKLKSYLGNFSRFDFNSISNQFRLIEDNESQSLFIPVEIEIPEEYTKEMLYQWGILNNNDLVSGEKLFDRYISIIKNDDLDFIKKQIELKKIIGLMSQFTISVYPTVKDKLNGKFDEERGKYGYLYLLHNKQSYSVEEGFNLEKAEQDVFF